MQKILIVEDDSDIQELLEAVQYLFKSKRIKARENI